MNILRGMALVVLTLLLAACGASVEVPETVTDTARLELQVLTSLSDSDSVDYLEVFDASGETLYYVSDFVNRFHTLELEMGETYQIAARAKLGADAQQGTVSFTTEVTLVSANQDLTVDLRQAYSVRVYVEMDGRLSVFLSIQKNQQRGSSAAGIPFVGGSYTSYAQIPIEAVSSFGSFGQVLWNGSGVAITPHVFGEEGFDSTVLHVQYASIPPVSCVTNIGLFNLSWEDGASELNQELEVFIPCRG